MTHPGTQSASLTMSFWASLVATVIWAVSGTTSAAQSADVSDLVDPAFVQAVEALDDPQGDVGGLLRGTDPLYGDLVRWLDLRDDETDDVPFDQFTALLNSRPDWPGLSRIRAAAERSIDDSVADADILAFFDGHDVQTGQGAVAYAGALTRAGRGAEADTLIAAVWTTKGLTDAGHQAIIDAHADLVAPLHVARADMLLWRWRTSDVQNVLPLLDDGTAALVRARIGYITKADDLNDRRALVPDRLRGDPGLAYDRFNWLADRTDWTNASELLLAQSVSADRLGVPWRWGSWRRILARWNMREGRIDRAYALAADHFIAPQDRNYADLEWLAGYIALTYLRDFDRALLHFEAFDAAVTSPISKGRAGYWLGRAHEGRGDAEAAVAAFQAGAQHQTSFYGLLSAEQLGLTMDPDLVGGETYGDWRRGPVLQNEAVRAGLALLAAGERGSAVLFIRDAAADMDRFEIGQLGQMLMDLDEPFYTVLAAKTAAREGILVQDVYFPIHPMAEMALPVEPALALAIARQESEFRVDAGSSVGALGLMQLMPGTAQDVAGWLDVPYSRARLTTDWEYNAALGGEYLAYLTRLFGNSPVMIAAGYNAGPGRPRDWMSERGDPRRGFDNETPVDVIDWIEHIPFRETRNYVMRVTEGIPVYRARLTGRIAPVRFTDLLIGETPVIRPVARPDRAAPDLLRPVARSDG
ncbi:lytic transglycosylase domain-containing protein [Pseudooctadecabacter jejudonensis]|uniref:Soluble lytic murein transglycosylase n=1 Tax=Pseudooctadecabacter jejudonensis TaxID=1391910 RepID=A0A1Y5S0I1_9RHOB|nr:lytic transglycosylase domain-containing protein [Pseudooctadecabacter jejudonensis]SLN29671.1 Soluble lytic murein transglycosylase precursor [Pseudooctadecabacter jejudonensis]